MKWNYYNKYKSHKTNANGVIFDSKKEYDRYIELTLLSRSGAIKGLKRQVKFELIPAQYEPDIISPRGKVKKGKCKTPRNFTRSFRLQKTLPKCCI